MITRDKGRTVLLCDICGEQADEEFVDLWAALDFKESYGWKSRLNRRGEWEDVCPDCRKDVA